MRRKTFIIAEAWVNHNGSLELAKKMIDAAVDAGAGVDNARLLREKIKYTETNFGMEGGNLR